MVHGKGDFAGVNKVTGFSLGGLSELSDWTESNKMIP